MPGRIVRTGDALERGTSEDEVMGLRPTVGALT
jgi:hypothetical protein